MSAAVSFKWTETLIRNNYYIFYGPGLHLQFNWIMLSTLECHDMKIKAHWNFLSAPPFDLEVHQDILWLSTERVWIDFITQRVEKPGRLGKMRKIINGSGKMGCSDGWMNWRWWWVASLFIFLYILCTSARRRGLGDQRPNRPFAYDPLKNRPYRRLPQLIPQQTEQAESCRVKNLPS